MNQTAVLKALSSSPLDLLNRWKNYQDEKSKEKFDVNTNFPPNNPNFPNFPPNNPPPSNNNSEDKWLFGLSAGMFFIFLLIIIQIYNSSLLLENVQVTWTAATA